MIRGVKMHVLVFVICLIFGNISFCYGGNTYTFYAASDGYILAEPKAGSKIVSAFKKWDVFCDAEQDSDWVVLRKMEIENVEKIAWVYWRNREPAPINRPSVGDNVDLLRINEEGSVIPDPIKRSGTIIEYTGKRKEVALFGKMIFICEEVVYQAKEPIEHYIKKDKLKKISGKCYEIKNKLFLIKNNPDWPPIYVKLILDNKIAIGMSKDQVKAAWGIPTVINDHITKQRNHEQWVYRNFDSYVYFTNGLVDAIQ